MSRGYSLELGGVNAPGIHYNIVGTAVMGEREPVPLMPHTHTDRVASAISLTLKITTRPAASFDAGSAATSSE